MLTAPCFSNSRRDLLKISANYGLVRFLATLGAGVVTTQLAGCGGGGTNIASGNTTQPAQNALSLNIITQTSVALKPTYLTTTGLDINSGFALSLLDSHGNPLMALSPLRIAPDGTVVISLPLCFSGADGSTRGYSCILSLTQNGVSAPSPVIAVSDLPAASTYGMQPGQASHDLYVFLEISLGRTLNTLQALALTSGITTNLTAVTSHVSLLLLNTIMARNDVDRVMMDPTTSIHISTASDGTPISYTGVSTEIQDRIALNYLSSFLPSSQTLSAASANQHAAFSLPRSLSDLIRRTRRMAAWCSARREMRRCVAHNKRFATMQCAAQPSCPLGCNQKPRLRRCKTCQWNDHLLRFTPCIHRFLVATGMANQVRQAPRGITDLQALITSITTLSGALALKSSYNTLTSADSSVLDNMPSGASAAQALVSTGATIAAVGAAAFVCCAGDCCRRRGRCHIQRPHRGGYWRSDSGQRYLRCCDNIT